MGYQSNGIGTPAGPRLSLEVHKAGWCLILEWENIRMGYQSNGIIIKWDINQMGYQ